MLSGHGTLAVAEREGACRAWEIIGPARWREIIASCKILRLDWERPLWDAPTLFLLLPAAIAGWQLFHEEIVHMRSRNVFVESVALLAIVTAAALLFATHATAQETILYSFIGGKVDGSDPISAVIFDGTGNLYGSTFYGDKYNHGSVFKLTPNASGEWTETVLHVFNSEGDGHNPRGPILDGDGNLYGVTEEGGVYDKGTVFELSPSAGGAWTETLLHEFGGGHDGQQPVGGLNFDASGNLYGTTISGGSNNSGMVFKLTPSAGGSWTENILHEFKHDGSDGMNPGANLTFDAFGNLYGTTTLGGTYNKGVVFELTPGAGGSWNEITLYSFGADKDGTVPYSEVIFDGAGNLYGTTSEGGDHANGGTVFELTPQTGGVWTEAILHDFGQSDADGNYPTAGLIFDASGNLYGDTNYGGTYEDGTVFELTPGAAGSWTETILHRYGNGADGRYPDAPLIFGASGNLYGTTSEGGTDSTGTVFEITR
jgi:uncharacterized repeat protein (TIGR03803 family)